MPALNSRLFFALVENMKYSKAQIISIIENELNHETESNNEKIWILCDDDFIKNIIYRYHIEQGDVINEALKSLYYKYSKGR